MGGKRRPSVFVPMAKNDMSNEKGLEEFSSLKRARRLLRICDIAVTKSGDEQQSYLERACFGDPGLLAEAKAILAAVEASGEFMLDRSWFPSLPPKKS